MKDLKIALCFSGQPRTWKLALPSIQNFIAGFETRPDIFMHTWDFNTDISRTVVLANKSSTLPHTNITKEELTELNEVFKPVSTLVEDINVSRNISKRVLDRIVTNRGTEEHLVLNSPQWIAPQYYGIKKAAALKRNYELKNGFFYDTVIRMRYDSFLSHHDQRQFHQTLQTPESFNIYSTATHIIQDFPKIIVGDVLFYANSHTYDVVSDYIDYLPYIFECNRDRYFFPEKLFSIYLQSMYLKINSVDVNCKLTRDEQYFNTLKKYGAEPYTCDIGAHSLEFKNMRLHNYGE